MGLMDKLSSIAAGPAGQVLGGFLSGEIEEQRLAAEIERKKAIKRQQLTAQIHQHTRILTQLEERKVTLEKNYKRFVRRESRIMPGRIVPTPEQILQKFHAEYPVVLTIQPEIEQQKQKITGLTNELRTYA